MKTVKLFDTTLRDGAQTEGISFSLEDKLKIAKLLDELGIHYIEGGWPGSNPKDIEFFKAIKNVKLKNAKIVAFSSTRRPKIKVEADKNIATLLAAETPVVELAARYPTCQLKTLICGRSTSGSTTRMLCGDMARWTTRLSWANRTTSVICRSKSSRASAARRSPHWAR